MTSPNRSKKPPTPKRATSTAPQDLTPSEIESLRRDAQRASEEMDRLDAEEESQQAKLPPAVDDPCKSFRDITAPESASQIKAAFKAGRLSREEAVRQLQALGFQ
jgi:hypothetical protein